jgi:hypothetical protein
MVRGWFTVALVQAELRQFYCKMLIGFLTEDDTTYQTIDPLHSYDETNRRPRSSLIASIFSVEIASTLLPWRT